MRYLLVSAALLGFAVPAHAADANLTGFNAIDAQGQYRVEVTIGDHYAVSVEGPDASGVQIRNSEHTLELRQIAKTGWFGGSHRLNAVVHIVTPSLNAITSSRGLEFSAAGIHADQLDVHGSMGTEMELSGVCGALSIHGSMGADINAKGLDCASAEVDAEMGADIEARAHESAVAHASMGGDIRISGNPQRRDRRTGLGGDVSFE
jgi:hypothetical protein